MEGIDNVYKLNSAYQRNVSKPFSTPDDKVDGAGCSTTDAHQSAARVDSLMPYKAAKLFQYKLTYKQERRARQAIWHCDLPGDTR